MFKFIKNLFKKNTTENNDAPIETFVPEKTGAKLYAGGIKNYIDGGVPVMIFCYDGSADSETALLVKTLSYRPYLYKKFKHLGDSISPEYTAKFLYYRFYGIDVSTDFGKLIAREFNLICGHCVDIYFQPPDDFTGRNFLTGREEIRKLILKPETYLDFTYNPNIKE